jgi:hypothetical protein
MNKLTIEELQKMISEALSKYEGSLPKRKSFLLEAPADEKIISSKEQVKTKTIEDSKEEVIYKMIRESILKTKKELGG